MKKIMIVDDSLIIRINLKKMFEKNGFEVVAEAVNGQDAIDKFKSYQPDVTTMDITMPVMDGIAALREIKKLDADACVVMISALGQEGKVVECLNLGARHYILKPINENGVLDVIKAVLSKPSEEKAYACDVG